MLRFKHSFECENCTSGFHKKGSLQNHMTISHRRDITVIIALKKFTQRFLCRVTWLSSTGMISVQQVWLQSSRKSSPEETHNCLSQGWYQCSSCDYKVHVRAPLRRHTIVSHMGKYKCNDCDMEDSYKDACWNSQNGMRDGWFKSSEQCPFQCWATADVWRGDNGV